MSRAPRLLVAGLTLLLAACSGSSGEKTAADPTPVSWPQPVDGKLTPQMCDLLTPDDFLATGVGVMAWESKKPVPDAGPNAVTCHALGSTWFSLNLQPDPVSAELYYQYMLAEHRREGSKTVQEGGVPAAEASWFDAAKFSASKPEHDFWARRGSLLVSFHLGFLHNEENYDPRKAAATLATLVLERIPQVGKVATGKPHQIVLAVTGKGVGTAAVTSGGPLDDRAAEEAGAKLPWTRRLQAPWFGTRLQLVELGAMNTTLQAGKPGVLTCTVTVDGKQVARQSSIGFVSCNQRFRDTP